MTRKFILHFKHSVSQAEVVNNVSCPRQQYFIILLLSSRFILCSKRHFVLYMLYVRASERERAIVCVCVCACIWALFHKIFYRSFVYIWCCIPIFFWHLDWQVADTEGGHRQPNYISDKEKVSTLCINSTTAATTFIRFTQMNWYLCH